MIQVKNISLFNVILLFSIFALLAAYFIQYILGHQPCSLCLMERIPYMLSIIIITLSFLFKKYQKFYLSLLILTFITSTLLSFYHFGIEQNFISESIVCDLNSENNSISAEEILKELKDSAISCKNVTFKIFGLSLATINTLISLIISVSLTKIFLNYEKNR